jgi:hypothetical protein
MIMEHWWNGTERENLITRRKLLPSPFVHRESYMNWSGIETLPPRLDDGEPCKIQTSVKSVVRFLGREKTAFRQAVGSDQWLLAGGNNELFLLG